MRCPDPRSEDAPTAREPGNLHGVHTPGPPPATACSGSEEADGEEGPRPLPWRRWVDTPQGYFRSGSGPGHVPL